MISYKQSFILILFIFAVFTSTFKNQTVGRLTGFVTEQLLKHVVEGAMKGRIKLV
jgi:hypothetical protein